MVDVEATVLEAAARVLNVSATTPQDNFFELGGDSLAAMELLAIVEQEVGIAFPLDVLFASGDLGDIVHACTRLATSHDEGR